MFNALTIPAAPPIWNYLMEALQVVCFLWLLVGWPIGSLAALLYFSSTDRDTRWWLFKSLTALGMLLLWLLVFALALTMVTGHSGEDFD
jgi:hypothetical protein